jgi:FkbM family methyltransferase
MTVLRALGRALGLGSKRRDTEAFAAQRRLVRNERAVILDVGAHLGETAQRYRALFPHATIHCFEPFPASFAALSRTLAPDTRVQAHAVALGAAAGHGTLNVNRSSATNSLLRSDERAASYWGRDLLDTAATIEVPVTTLDLFCAERSIPRLDVLKLDVQGAEFEVLGGAAGLLRAQAIDVVYMEMIVAPTYVGQRDMHDYLGLFRSYGYVLFDFFNPVRKHGRLLQTDNLFVADSFLAAYEHEQSGAR